MRRWHFRGGYTALLFLALAAPASSGQEEPQVWALELKEDPAVQRAKVAVLTGTADEEGHRFSLEQLSILQPVMVALGNADGSDDLRLELSKYHFDQPLWAGRTRDGYVEHRLKTEGELRVRVRSTGGEVPYDLVVWVSDPIEPELPAVVVSMEEFEGGGFVEGGGPAGGGGGSPVMWLIAVALVGILGVLVYMAKQGRSAS